jgi:hypothetical protein
VLSFDFFPKELASWENLTRTQRLGYIVQNAKKLVTKKFFSPSIKPGKVLPPRNNLNGEGIFCSLLNK